MMRSKWRASSSTTEVKPDPAGAGWIEDDGGRVGGRGAASAWRCLRRLPEITLESAEPPMRHLAEELGLSAGQLFGILRVAVTGQKVSPPLFESMEIIGKAKVLERIEEAA